jgi:hypothetical protein
MVIRNVLVFEHSSSLLLSLHTLKYIYEGKEEFRSQKSGLGVSRVSRQLNLKKMFCAQNYWDLNTFEQQNRFFTILSVIWTDKTEFVINDRVISDTGTRWTKIVSNNVKSVIAIKSRPDFLLYYLFSNGRIYLWLSVKSFVVVVFGMLITFHYCHHIKHSAVDKRPKKIKC